jgi:hypothetical protein
MPCGYRVNPEMQEELGFLPLLAAAPSVIGGAGKLLGGLFGKKKKKAAPPPPPAPAVSDVVHFQAFPLLSRLKM